MGNNDQMGRAKECMAIERVIRTSNLRVATRKDIIGLDNSVGQSMARKCIKGHWFESHSSQNAFVFTRRDS